MSSAAIIEKANLLMETRQLVLIAIDGCGGAGKSTLAQFLAAHFSASTIVHMDDFYKLPAQRATAAQSTNKPGCDYDIERLVEQVILPLRQNKQAEYFRNDWQSDDLIYDGLIQPKGVIIIEGCYSLLAQLRKYYDISAFVCCDRKTRLARGLARDGAGALAFWENWMAAEDRYLAEQSPEAAADFVIDGELPYH